MTNVTMGHLVKSFPNEVCQRKFILIIYFFFVEMLVVPSNLKQFLVAKISRNELKLDASHYLIDIGLPSFCGKVNVLDVG